MKISNPTKLQLSYISPSLWWNRSLPVNSKEWKQLRLQVLERDNYTCNFCGIRLSKYLIVDHINGDATNNELSNLRVNCPACDRIRHCGLAGIKGELIVGQSSVSQVEIVKQTVQYYLATGQLIEPKMIDSRVKIIPLDPVFFVDQPGYQGFFTSEMNFSYLRFVIN